MPDTVAGATGEATGAETSAGATSAGATETKAGETDGMGENDPTTSLPLVRQKTSAMRSARNTPAASQRNVFM